eukprot:COSAG06_NODE_15696_length_1052_cov_1.220357_1_plen_63_part_01
MTFDTAWGSYPDGAVAEMVLEVATLSVVGGGADRAEESEEGTPPEEGSVPTARKLPAYAAETL